MNKIIVTATYIPTSTHDKKKKVTEIFFTETHFFFKNIKAYISMIFFKIHCRRHERFFYISKI